MSGEVINYNIYVFNGKVVFFSVAGGLGDGIGEHLTYYYADGSLAPFKNKDYPVKEEKLSDLLPQMEELAVFLAKGFPMVRVDLFDIGGKIILSEMTFSPGISCREYYACHQNLSPSAFPTPSAVEQMYALYLPASEGNSFRYSLSTTALISSALFGSINAMQQPLKPAPENLAP